MKNFIQKRRHTGFTLVEMLVVLFILVVLSAVAVESLDGIQDQTRYQASQQSMQNIEDAIVGPANQRQPDGTLLTTGFVADMGRLPQAVSVNVTLADGSTATYLEPQELWIKPAGVNSFAVLQAVAANLPAVNALDFDLDVWVPCGWRGPYLRLGAGQPDLRDGWGNPYDLLKGNRSLCVAGDPVSILRSNGADGIANTSPPPSGSAIGYNPDLYVNFNTISFDGSAGKYPAVSASDRIHAAPSAAAPLIVTVQNASGSALTSGDNIIVQYFGPNGATGGINLVKASQSVPAGAPATLTFTITDLSITIGPRAIRAYNGANASTATLKSQIAQVVLVAGGGASVPVLSLK